MSKIRFRKEEERRDRRITRKKDQRQIKVGKVQKAKEQTRRRIRKKRNIKK